MRRWAAGREGQGAEATRGGGAEGQGGSEDGGGRGRGEVPGAERGWR